MKRVVTVLCALFLAAIPLALAWYVITTITSCFSSSCNPWDASSVGGLLGFGLLALVIWIGKRVRK